MDPEGPRLIALDTNLLVYAHRAGTPEHRAARRAIQRAADDPRGFGIASPCLAELFAVVTHRSAAGRPSTPTEVQRFVSALVDDGGAVVWLPREGLHARLLEEARRRDLQGARIFDLQIALVAAEGGATELWSHDRRFLVTAGLRLVDPLAS